MKRKQRPAQTVAYLMGFVTPQTTFDGKKVQYGIKAIVGQYVRPYIRDDGTEGLRDYAAIINYNR